METLNWDDLQIFLAAHKAGSFSAAARALSTEQSTVSRRIASLEEALGGAVFLRSRKGLVLTEHGERILPQAYEASLLIQELAATSGGDRVEGEVRIALTESMAMYGLASALMGLFAKYPDVRLRLVSSTAMSDLSRREADLALRLVQPLRGDLVFKRVAQMGNGLWGHKRWADCQWEDLEWVQFNMESGPTTAGAWVQENASRPPRLVTNGFIGMVEALRYGIGVGILPNSLGRQVPELIPLNSPAPTPPPTPIFLVAHRASRHVQRISAVWSFLEAQMCVLDDAHESG